MLHVPAVLPINTELCGVVVPDFRQTIRIFPGAGIVVERKARIEIDRRIVRYTESIADIGSSAAKGNVRY